MKRNHLTALLLIVLFSQQAMAQDENVSFSRSGGFYDDGFNLALSCNNSSHHVRYTINGAMPSPTSLLYVDSLFLDSTMFSPSNIFTIVDCPSSSFYLADSVERAIVIRAAVFDEDERCISDVRTNTYFIRSLGCDTHGLPAVSICADSLDLFDYERGILVPGIHFNPSNPDWTGNYYEEGDDWERLSNFEFYEIDNQGVNQISGLRTQGGNSRRFQQKGMKIYAHDDLGEKWFDYKFFETSPFNRFKHLTLKPFASAWNQSGVLNHVCNRIAATVNVESLASRAVAVFLNGEYWGIYFLQEKPDERYLQNHFGFLPEECNIMGSWNYLVENGDGEEFIAFIDWLETADLTDPDEYDYVASMIDIDCFTDYQILELFLENRDWPANNMRCYQAYSLKWRWIFYDGDGCLLYMTFTAFDNAVYVGDQSWPSNSRSTLLFRKLLENTTFKQKFKNRFDELLQTHFDYSETGVYVQEIKNQLIQEIPTQHRRFNYPLGMEEWNASFGDLNWILENRPTAIRPYVDELVGTDEWFSSADISCFPNPFEDELSVEFFGDPSEDCLLQIFDMIGHECYQQVVSASSCRVSVQLPSGMYLLKIGGQSKIVVRK